MDVSGVLRVNCRLSNERNLSDWDGKLDFFHYPVFVLSLEAGNDGISYRTFIKQQVSEKQFFSPLNLLVCILQKDNYFDVINFFLLKSAGTQ